MVPGCDVGTRVRVLASCLLLAPAAACGDGGEADGASAAAASDGAVGGAATQSRDSPSDADEPTGEFEVTVVAGDARSELSGPASFAAGRGDFSLHFNDDGGDRVVRLSGHQVFDEIPVEGDYTLGRRSRREPGWDATYVDLDPSADEMGANYMARSGTLTLASVSPARVEGEFDFLATSPTRGDTVRVSGAFQAICNTYAGPGECW